MKLAVYKEISARVPISGIRHLFEMVTEEEADPDWPAQINLVFTTDRKMRALNREFRSLDKSTDVLSFNLDSPREPGAVFGEIYISVPRARAQARAYDGRLWGEYLRLFCHGLLHLFGYDHVDARGRARMEKQQDRYLQSLKETGVL